MGLWFGWQPPQGGAAGERASILQRRLQRAVGVRYGCGCGCSLGRLAVTIAPMENSPSQPSAFRKLPALYAVIVLPLLLSCIMTCLISGISTLRGVGFAPGVLQLWLGSWGLSWLIAFPTLLAVLPLVRRLTAAVVEMPQ